MESNHLTATLLNMSTGLQPATGNILLNTLFPMCVLKHSNNATMCTGLQGPAVPIECFNTNWFLVPEEGFHPSRRPFAPCFKCGARTSFPVCSHFAVYNCPWAISRFLTARWYCLALVNLFTINCLNCSLVNSFCLVHSASLICLSIILLSKNKKPQGF